MMIKSVMVVPSPLLITIVMLRGKPDYAQGDPRVAFRDHSIAWCASRERPRRCMVARMLTDRLLDQG